MTDWLAKMALVAGISMLAHAVPLLLINRFVITNDRWWFGRWVLTVPLGQTLVYLFIAGFIWQPPIIDLKLNLLLAFSWIFFVAPPFLYFSVKDFVETLDTHVPTWDDSIGLMGIRGHAPVVFIFREYLLLLSLLLVRSKTVADALPAVAGIEPKGTMGPSYADADDGHLEFRLPVTIPMSRLMTIYFAVFSALGALGFLWLFTWAVDIGDATYFLWLGSAILAVVTFALVFSQKLRVDRNGITILIFSRGRLIPWDEIEDFQDAAGRLNILLRDSPQSRRSLWRSRIIHLFFKLEVDLNALTKFLKAELRRRNA